MMSEEFSTILLRLSEEVERLSQRVSELEQRNQELEAENKQLRAENKQLRTENEQLKELLHKQGVSKDAKTPEFKENYSVEQQKEKGKRGKQATGRRTQDEKLSFVSYDEDVYPEGVRESECIEQRLLDDNELGGRRQQVRRVDEAQRWQV